jgi:formate dehydrogenase major subunit
MSVQTIQKTVNLTIDECQVTVPKGRTILEAALDVGVDIPRLCHDPRLKPVGACRLCIVGS